MREGHRGAKGEETIQRERVWREGGREREGILFVFLPSKQELYKKIIKDGCSPRLRLVGIRFTVAFTLQLSRC